MATGIRKRGKNSYEIRIDLGRDKEDRRHWHTCTVRGKESEAIKRRTELLYKHHKGQLAPPTKMLLRDYMTLWLTETLPGTVATRTETDYEEMNRLYIEPYIGHVKLSALGPLDIQRLYAELLARKLSRSTIANTKKVLNRALKQALRWGMIAQNPVGLVDSPRLIRRRMTALSAEQVNRLLTAARANRYAAMWHLAVDSGMRPEEYLGLKWTDIDFVQGIVHVERGLCWNRRGGGYYFSDAKTDSSRRQIPITPQTVELLKSHWRQQLEWKLAAGQDWPTADSDMVFTTRKGSPLRLAQLRELHWIKLLKAADLPMIRIYDLRHTCATLLLAANVHPKIVADRLGHASIKQTLDTYSHVLPDMQMGARRALEEMVFAKLGTA